MFFTSVANYNEARPFIIRFDYDVRTDGQPLYQGFALTNTAEGTADWLIYKYTYDGNNNVTKRDVSYGSWTGRAGLTYA